MPTDQVLKIVLTSLCLLAACGYDSQVSADEVRLKNGITLVGTPNEINGFSGSSKGGGSGGGAMMLSVTNPRERYYVPVTQKASMKGSLSPSDYETFVVKQNKDSGASRPILTVQGYSEKPTAFDQFGRRNVKLNSGKSELHVSQGVTEITRDYIKLTALNYVWETSIATSSVPFEQIDAMLRELTDAGKADDRLKIARFYVQAAYYEPARRELDALKRDFPDQANVVKQIQSELTLQQNSELFNELELRRRAGQHQFAFDIGKKFPVDNVDPAVLRVVREYLAEYENAQERCERAKADFGTLQGLMKTDPRFNEIGLIRADIAERLSYTSVQRLDAYFKLASDAQLKPEEKLALAISGWVVGSTNAIADLNQALQLWQARSMLLDYLRAAPESGDERKAILARLEALQGVSPERIAQILPLLPPPLDAAGATPGKASRIEVATASARSATGYWASLPSEYSPDKSFPLIIALHSETGSPQQEIEGFWGGTEERTGQSQRRGYVVIAPEYVPKANAGKGYDYGPEAHQTVLQSLRDALLRFNVDANRVFLSGHGMGGEAAWDLGLSHPHLFAGVIPINGAIDRYSRIYLENARGLPLYMISGQLDSDLWQRNAKELPRLMQMGGDVIYAEHAGAGPESFYSEINSLFEWMSRHTRGGPPVDVEFRTLRETDNSLWWFEFSGIPESMKGIDWSNAKKKAIHPLVVTAKITPGNSIAISSRAANHTTVWLARGDGRVDFNKRLQVRINGKQRWNDFVKPDLVAMLDHVRIHGDRHCLYWGRLEFGN